MYIKNLIVGAGLSGITLAQKLAEKGEKVLIVEQRNHIGGNCYDYYDENGILIHKYGPHIFHTDFEDVWNYVNRFSEFTNYQHKVIGFIDGNLVPIPFNLNSLYLCFSKGLAEGLENILLKYFEYNSKVTIGTLREIANKENNSDLLFLSNYIFEKVFKNYTVKQRGITVEEIDPNVVNRVPIVISRDNRYFPNQKYQGMPKYGYTKMFEKMLDSENIKICLNTKFSEIKDQIEFENLYFTGSIDEYFDYKYGKLGYRKTLYKMESKDLSSYQENAVINYPNDYEYTRISEFKKFYPDSSTINCNKTVICKEVPGIGEIEAYPINSEENQLLLEKYQKENNNQNVKFIGRLGEYKYYDMDKIIKNILDMFKG